MKDGKVIIWMNLLGFDMYDPDRGVERYFNQTGFVPEGVAALLFHADFFHQHRGMEEEYELSPDNCSYYATPCNTERERQPWTNYALRELSANLRKHGSCLYASVMGSVLNNAFHKEWVSDHPEVRRHGCMGEENIYNKTNLFLLKRFKDGSYYEDFFIDKVCQTLQDYDLQGIHMADVLCPAHPGSLHNSDFSTDFVEQFLNYANITLPEEIAATMGCDNQAAELARADYIYNNLREEFVQFNAWRWEAFFQKICARVHAIGKEVLVLGMYCTDPFETLYCNGIDMRRIVNAGVDMITANLLPTSVFMQGPDSRPHRFHRYMAIAPLTAAHLPKGHLISMLGLQDATEEWSAMLFKPCEHERDMYTLMAYQLIDGDGFSRALDGYYLCLGDGISATEWTWERERLEIALTTKAARVYSPAMLWSDTAYEKMLHEYIHTRRWTPFKLFYELAIAGVHCAAAIRPEGIAQHTGTLVVPDFDMLSEEEQKLVAAYDRGSVFCTACPGFDPVQYGIQPEICFTDSFSSYPLTVFAFGCHISNEVRTTIANYLSEDDGTPNLEVDPKDTPEPYDYTLVETLIYSKVTAGFVNAMAALLQEITDSPFAINKPNMVLQMPNGAYRLYLFNDSEVKTHRVFVKAKNALIKDAKIVSKYPVLPPRFMDEGSGLMIHLYSKEITVKRGFEMNTPPGGVSIVDVWLEEK